MILGLPMSAMATDSLRLLPPESVPAFLLAKLPRSSCGRASRVSGAHVFAPPPPLPPAPHLCDLGVDDAFEVGGRDALDARVELEVLARRQQLEQRVPLRAVAEEAAQLGLLRQDVVARELGRAARREDVAREHLERRRLAGAVDAEVACSSKEEEGR